MYVRKFEAETMEQALKDIKSELGPDAIILKTMTNKGLKGAFKKNKIEITAAISEKNYTKKAKVDHILDDDQKDQFYQNSSSYISEMITQREQRESEQFNHMEVKDTGYGSLGLNRQVRQREETKTQPSAGSSLDDFLSSGAGERVEENVALREAPRKEVIEQTATPRPVGNYSYEPPEQTVADSAVVEKQKEKIDYLEKELFELKSQMQRLDRKEAIGIYELRTTLRALDVSETYIQRVIKKAVFEMSRDDLENSDLVYEFALREMINSIHTSMPLFSNLEGSEESAITVLVSTQTSGQTSTLNKLAAMKKDAVIIRKQGEKNFSEEIFNLEVNEASNISEIISHARKAKEKGQSVFIDFKNFSEDLVETKKFINGLKRSFGKVEVLICLSSIHSEIYNRKVIEQHCSFSDGMILTHLDQCMNYGSLFNITEAYPSLPFKFFGTGEVIPDDLEAATAERILSGMFQMN